MLSFSDSDSRVKPRRVVRARIKLALGKDRVIAGRTVDIGEEGLGAELDAALPVGASCAIRVDVFTAGQASQLETEVKVAFCICNNRGFRVGLQFKQPDPRAADFLRRLL